MQMDGLRILVCSLISCFIQNHLEARKVLHSVRKHQKRLNKRSKIPNLIGYTNWFTTESHIGQLRHVLWSLLELRGCIYSSNLVQIYWVYWVWHLNLCLTADDSKSKVCSHCKPKIFDANSIRKISIQNS